MSDMQLQRRQDQPVATITTGFGTQEVAMRGERAAEAVAARETAAVQARFVMAIQRPRDTMDFRTRLLHECKRPGFAEVAMFARPVGKEKNKVTGQWEEKIATGPSIRMIETCLQLFRNVAASTTTVYDGPDIRIVKVCVTDFEANISFDLEVNVPKQVEKRQVQDYKTKEWGPPKGREVLSERFNTEGEVTYTVAATDDEVIIKQAALVSKALRTCGQRLLPRDIIEDAIAQIQATKSAETKADPDAAKKKVLDAFATLGVLNSDIAAYIGHSIEKASPAEIEKLRVVYSSIKQGESTWEEFVSAANTTPEPELQEEVKARLIAEAAAKQKPVTVKPLDEMGVSEADIPQTQIPLTEDQNPDGYAKELPAEKKRRTGL